MVCQAERCDHRNPWGSAIPLESLRPHALVPNSQTRDWRTPDMPRRRDFLLLQRCHPWQRYHPSSMSRRHSSPTYRLPSAPRKLSLGEAIPRGTCVFDVVSYQPMQTADASSTTRALRGSTCQRPETVENVRIDLPYHVDVRLVYRVLLASTQRGRRKTHSKDERKPHLAPLSNFLLAMPLVADSW